MIGGWGEEKPRKDRAGETWHFAYWYNVAFRGQEKLGQRLAFWNDAKTECGVMLFLPGKAVAYKRIVDQIKNLTANAELRRKHLFPLQFPLHKHYFRYGDFPAEQEYLKRKEEPWNADGISS